VAIGGRLFRTSPRIGASARDPAEQSICRRQFGRNARQDADRAAGEAGTGPQRCGERQAARDALTPRATQLRFVVQATACTVASRSPHRGVALPRIDERISPTHAWARALLKVVLRWLTLNRSNPRPAVDIRDDVLEVAREVNRLIGVDDRFDPLVDRVLASLRARLAVPDVKTHGFVDPVVEAEFRAARERLVRFRSEFEEAHARILLRHLGGEHLTRLGAALADDAAPFVRAFLKAMAAVASDSAQETRDLAQRMNDVLMFEEPER
jgi:hypothetical protein